MIQPKNMQYPQQGGANAVSINIYNPQAYGGNATAPAQGVPYNYTNSLYNMPQGSVYAQAMPMHQGFAPQYMPMANPIVQQQQFVAPAPQAMPESVMVAPQVQEMAPAQMQAEAQAPQAEVQGQHRHHLQHGVRLPHGSRHHPRL